MLIFRIVHWFNFNFREYVFVLNNFFLVLTLFSSVLTDFPGGSDGKASAYDAGDLGLILGWEDPLEKEMATHSSILASKILRTEEPSRLQSMGSQRVRHD